MNNYHQRIKVAYSGGNVNKYMSKRLSDAAEDGMTDNLYDELERDAIDASDVGVESDRDYNIYFFVSSLVDDILLDTFNKKISPEDKKELCRFILSHKNDKNYKLDNLTDYRILIHKWLCDSLSKKAHPNISGKNIKDPTYLIDKWIDAIKKIYSIIHTNNIGRRDAFDYVTSDWDADERSKFDNWMKYYESGNTEKYNVKTAQFKNVFGAEIPIPSTLLNRREQSNSPIPISTYKANLEPTKKEIDVENAKQFKAQMRSRLYSFRKLLEKYHDILSKQNIDQIYDELFALEKSVGKLNVYASLRDRAILSANRIKIFGFPEGADMLEKFAAEPAVGQGVMSALPQTGSKEPNLPPQSTSMAGIQDVINRLESIGKNLKSRDMIRELASIDILLNEMGMASYFPELSDSQAKLIEAYGYASNKVEAIIAKLRGSGPSKPKKTKEEATPDTINPLPIKQSPPTPAQKPMETGEIMDKPVGKVENRLPIK